MSLPELNKTNSRIILGIILLAGLAYRLKGINYSLLPDESMYGLLILMNKIPFWDWYQQTEHPILHYLTGWVGVKIFGPTELGLRLQPLLAGLGSIGLAYTVARRIGGYAAGLWAAFALCFSHHLAGYQIMFGTYAMHLVVALALIALAQWAREAPSLGRTLTLTGASVVMSFAAFPALFVEGGVGLLLLIDWLVSAKQSGQRDKARTTLLAIYLGWLVLAGLIALIPASRIVFVPPHSTSITGTYRFFFWPDVGFLHGLQFIFANQLETLLAHFLPFTSQVHTSAVFFGLTLFIAAVGFSVAVKATGEDRIGPGRTLLLILAGAAGAQLVAMALGLYTIIWRHSLYFAVFFLVLVGLGLAETGRWLLKRKLYPALAVGLVVLALLPARALVKTPWIHRDEATAQEMDFSWNPFLPAMEKKMQDGDALYVDTASAAQLVFEQRPDRADLVDFIFDAWWLLYKKERRWWKGQIPGRIEQGIFFDKKLTVQLGGDSLADLLARQPDRLWLFFCQTQQTKVEDVEAQLTAGYHLVEEIHPPGPPFAGASLKLFQRN